MTLKQKRYGFLIPMLFFLLLFLFVGMVTRGSSIVACLHNFPDDTFMDFYNSLGHGKHAYENGVIYPPLANLIYYLLHALVERDVYYTGVQAVRTSQSGMLLLSMYLVGLVLFFTYGVHLLYKGSENEKFVVTTTLLFSAPFVFLIERANIVFLCLCFIMIFVWGYDSEKKWQKHIAFISLAIAVGIKGYPAVFGLFLLRDKKFKDAAILCLYGIVIFFAPFVFFGGLGSVTTFFKNLLSTSDYMGQIGYGWKVNLTNTMGWIGVLTGAQEACRVIGLVLLVLCAAGGAFLMVFSHFDEKWKTVAIPCILMVACPGFSFVYCLIFLSIPLLLFLSEEEKKKTDIVYLVLFVLLFAQILNPHAGFLDKFANDHYILAIPTIVESLALLVFIVMIYVEGFRTLGKKKASTPAQQ